MSLNGGANDTPTTNHLGGTMVRRFFESRSVLRRALFLGVLVLVVALSSSALFAQNMSSTASISGIVSDPQGARVTGAVLTLSSLDQGITRKFTTTSTGTYSFNLLPPATYTLKIVVTGFAPLEQDGIVLGVDQ